MTSKDKEDKLKNLKFIKDFNKITVSSACKEENIRRSNLYSLKISKSNLERLKNNIDKKIKDLYEGYNEDNPL